MLHSIQTVLSVRGRRRAGGCGAGEPNAGGRRAVDGTVYCTQNLHSITQSQAVLSARGGRQTCSFGFGVAYGCEAAYRGRQVLLPIVCSCVEATQLGRAHGRSAWRRQTKSKAVSWPLKVGT